MHPQRFYTLTASCPDRVGIVAQVAGFIAAHDGWILETSHHAHAHSDRYFMRIEIQANSLPFDLARFRELFAPIATGFAMQWQITDSAVNKRVAIMVSKQGTCRTTIPKFARIERILEEARTDSVVLARCMQILPPALCARYPGKIINIHHSFLPSFVGAKPGL